MTIRRRVGLLVLLCCVVFVGAAIGLRGQAQVSPVPLGVPDQRIISGSDLGFRVEGRARGGSHDAVKGTLMVRINGQWVPVGGPGVAPLQSR
jgi:hypothetical protein